MGFLTKAKDELRQVGLVTLYFIVCFGIVLMLKKLLLALAFFDDHQFVAADSRLGKGTLWRALWGRE